MRESLMRSVGSTVHLTHAASMSQYRHSVSGFNSADRAVLKQLGLCQQLKSGRITRSKPIRPAESVKDHSTSGLVRLKTRRKITIPLFHPSCWYNGNRFPTASTRLRIPKNVPQARAPRMRFTAMPASSTNNCWNNGRLCKAQEEIDCGNVHLKRLTNGGNISVAYPTSPERPVRFASTLPTCRLKTPG